MSEKSTRRPGAGTLGVMVVAMAFIAGPTPGDIGGCGNSLSQQTVPGDQPQSEYDYFDQSLCAHMCLRLRDLGVICQSLDPVPSSCDPNGAEAYVQCIRGGISTRIFGAATCPHACANYHGVYTGATLMDVDVCGSIIDGMNENQIASVIQAPPGPCVGVCQ